MICSYLFYPILQLICSYLFYPILLLICSYLFYPILQLICSYLVYAMLQLICSYLFYPILQLICSYLFYPMLQLICSYLFYPMLQLICSYLFYHVAVDLLLPVLPVRLADGVWRRWRLPSSQHVGHQNLLEWVCGVLRFVASMLCNRVFWITFWRVLVCITKIQHAQV